MTARFFVVIPARHASTRLPGKPLADLGGEPMVVRVARGASTAGAAEVIVATDDERVLTAVTAAGFSARMTRTDHQSGSDRVMEVADACGWPPDAVVVNLQGDEPFMPPVVIAQVAGLLLDEPDAGVASLYQPIHRPAAVFDPNVVKVIVGADGYACYFSRAPVPFARDAFAAGAVAALPDGEQWLRHVGIYAYRLAALRQFVSLPESRLERLEALEQLRLVEHGVGIRMACAAAPVPGGVDTEADLQRARETLAGG